jgi:spermidine synthase
MDDRSRRKIAESGPLTLARRGDVWEILWEGTFLMSSECRQSERELGALARGRTLVGGLGLGFTVRAALDAGATSIDVVEISSAVVEWNRRPLADLAGRPLDDSRVRLHEADVAAFVRHARDYDAILLDVDNGPSWTARPENAALYGEAGLSALRRALAPGGLLAIWSAQKENLPGFEERAFNSPVGGADYIYVTPRPRF